MSRNRRRRIAVIVAIVFCSTLGVGLAVRHTLPQRHAMCGRKMVLSREYSFVDFGDEYGENEGAVLDIVPAADKRRPETIPDVVEVPSGFHIREIPPGQDPGHRYLGKLVNELGTCSMLFIVTSGEGVESGFPGRTEPWIAGTLEA